MFVPWVALNLDGWMIMDWVWDAERSENLNLYLYPRNCKFVNLEAETTTHRPLPSRPKTFFATISRPVAIMGDFNLIRTPRGKSNDNFNSAEASLFNDFINNLGLMKILLLDRQFTWSNQHG
jgi:hypothetical protein